MFRGVPSEKISKKLVCKVCGYVEEKMPEHHGKTMRWSLAGSFRKVESLRCEVCTYAIEIPKHCNVPMFYSEGSYDDLPKLTKRDYESMQPSEEEE
ncbi:MAG: hypothetical protein QXU32_05200 [Nitrososphaerales archaeon]